MIKMAALLVVGLRSSPSALSRSAPALYQIYGVRQASSNNSVSQHKRGTGGRSSFSGLVVTVFGASGFLGRQIVNRLGRQGSQVIVPYRGDAYSVKDLRLCGDLGQILFMPFHLEDEESLRKAMKHSNVVVNCIGRDNPTKNFSFEQVHVTGARRLARIAREVGVPTFIHLSALNATPKPQRFYVGSDFLSSKLRGEEAVRSEFPDAVIVRPADMFGEGDRFLTLYAGLWRRLFGSQHVPLWRRGEQTVKQPVYVGDVADGVLAAARDRTAMGKTFEALGPERFLLSEIVDYVTRSVRRYQARRIRMRPSMMLRLALTRFGASANLPCLDRLEREFVSDNASGCPTLEDLGVSPIRLETRAQWIVRPFTYRYYYDEKLGEFEEPLPPTPLPSDWQMA